MGLRKLLCCLTAAVLFFSAGCGKKVADYDQNAVILKDDGAIEEKCVLELGEYGDTDQVNSFIQKSADEVNGGITDEDQMPVRFKEAERSGDTVSVELTYKAPEYYEELNNITFKVIPFGGDAYAEAAGDLEIKTSDGRMFDISEITDTEDCRILVFAPESEYILKTPGDITALSTNAELLGDDEALINGYSVIIFEN